MPNDKIFNGKDQDLTHCNFYRQVFFKRLSQTYAFL